MREGPHPKHQPWYGLDPKWIVVLLALGVALSFLLRGGIVGLNGCPALLYVAKAAAGVPVLLYYYRRAIGVSWLAAISQALGIALLVSPLFWIIDGLADSLAQLA